MNPDELDSVATQFGVARAQVERDHLISHLLGYLSAHFVDRIVFIGGTALARTHLVDGRLSEDIDLIAVGSRSEVARDLDRALPRAVMRSHGRLVWDSAITEVPEHLGAVLRSQSGLAVKVQLLSAEGRPAWPQESRQLEQRYEDAPHAELTVPVLPAFVAGKTATWCDRRASRDLWDLWALNRIGAFKPEVADLYRRFGPTNKLPGEWQFSDAPTESEWESQLSGQTRLAVTAREAASEVAKVWVGLHRK
ncbi:nucleotidyl transferase AbiEii/AbiGii toxin family protein [Rhodococcus sp. G-MC3]|uniref:nucleotidyl transferase AbiEii/AbiGii toxin family protein n=1 Tax=Rhodococcus sp. G-MC3 TaxID=3046209 RepID=UPI0024BA1DFD|nr:nucleotidyl transferase AbiEii/AbiGii toxin family protein [Rhodococcus sp. G-MC3]MDJ0396631.1 nucleotidyl transferase AbiEii/AbiGii toxin family protein [Rhodococcus sp. G-MC3]